MNLWDKNLTEIKFVGSQIQLFYLQLKIGKGIRVNYSSKDKIWSTIPRFYYFLKISLDITTKTN